MNVQDGLKSVKELSDLSWHPDRSLSNPSDDLLGRAPLAKKLAKGLLGMVTPEGQVVAILGSWGSGKSTLLRFISHYLKNTPEPSRPMVVDFNPWWFSGREDLTISFFDQLSIALGADTEPNRKIRKVMSDLARLVSHVPDWKAKFAANILELFSNRRKSVPELKAKLAELLSAGNKRLIVLIDDVDRLTPAETLDLFRLVKVVADFPNVMYVLAFDRNAVAAAITAAAAPHEASYGDSYLEKIIQLPVELPLPDTLSIRDMFFQGLTPLLSDQAFKLWDMGRRRELYENGIELFLKTPRDVVRFTNALKLTIPMTEGEVNPVDFVCVEALRVFRPRVYDFVRLNQEKFHGYTPSEVRDLEKLTRFHESWMEEFNEAKDSNVAKILMGVFPKFESAFKNVSYGGLQSDWRIQLRACSPDKCPVYFALNVPEGDISRMELEHIAALSPQPELFGQALLDLLGYQRPDGRTRAWQALEQLCDSDASIFPQDGISGAIKALLDVGDELIRAKDASGWWGVENNEMRIFNLIGCLVPRLPVEQRFGALKESVENGKSLFAVVELTTRLGLDHGKYSGTVQPEEVRLLRESELKAIESAALARIVQAAEAGSLLQSPRLADIMYRWKDWGGVDSVTASLPTFLALDENLLIFLEKMMTDERIGSSLDVLSVSEKQRYLQGIRSFLKSEDYAKRFEELLQQKDLSETHRRRLTLLLDSSEQQQALASPPEEIQS